MHEEQKQGQDTKGPGLLLYLLLALCGFLVVLPFVLTENAFFLIVHATAVIVPLMMLNYFVVKLKEEGWSFFKVKNAGRMPYARRPVRSPAAKRRAVLTGCVKFAPALILGLGHGWNLEYKTRPIPIYREQATRIELALKEAMNTYDRDYMILKDLRSLNHLRNYMWYLAVMAEILDPEAEGQKVGIWDTDPGLAIDALISLQGIGNPDGRQNLDLLLEDLKIKQLIAPLKQAERREVMNPGPDGTVVEQFVYAPEELKVMRDLMNKHPSFDATITRTRYVVRPFIEYRQGEGLKPEKTIDRFVPMLKKNDLFTVFKESLYGREYKEEPKDILERFYIGFKKVNRSVTHVGPLSDEAKGKLERAIAETVNFFLHWDPLNRANECAKRTFENYEILREENDFPHIEVTNQQGTSFKVKFNPKLFDELSPRP